MLKRVDAWLATHVTAVALAIIAAAAVLRVYDALATYVNPDEAQHFLAAHTSGLAETYRRSRSTAHPPLFLLLLHGVVAFGTAEPIIRLPNLVCGTLALWFAFRWLQHAAGDATALVGAAFLACAPGMISASTEARQYGLLLLGVCAALYCMERFVGQRSVAWVALYAASLYLAILSHYTAAWVALALAIYVPLRLWREHAPARLVVAWGCTQAGVAVLYAGLFATHLRVLRGAGMEAKAMTGWLKYSYYRPGEDPALDFAARALASAFQYLGGGPRLGLPIMLLFVGGLAAIVARWPRATSVRRDYALLLALPLLAGCAGALGRALPFGNSRHVSYLLPFVAAGVSVAVARLLLGRLSLVVAGSLLLARLWLAVTSPANGVEQMAHAHMDDALASLRAAAPAGTVVFTDRETHNVLAYYLQRDQRDLRLPVDTAAAETVLGGYRVVSNPARWHFTGADFVADLGSTSRALALAPGEPVWVFAVGWSDQAPFAADLPAQALATRKQFGPITLLQTAAGYVGD